MHYIDTVKSIANDTKYTQWYVRLITRARSRANTREEARFKLGYVERHHILPRSFNLGGDKDILNYAFLSAKEHYTCHRLLSKMFSGKFKNKMALAIWMFSVKRKTQERIKITSRTYEFIKKEKSAARKLMPAPNKGVPMSEEQKAKLRAMVRTPEHCANISKSKAGKAIHTPESRARLSEMNSGEKNPFFNKQHSEETKQHLSLVRLGVSKPPRSAEHRKSLSDANKGKPMSKEKRESMSQYLFKSGSEHPFAGGLPDSMKTTCEHCGKSMSKSMHTRWHGDRCKLKQSSRTSDC